MDPLYDIYLTGKLAEGTTPTDAGSRLAQLFKADRETMTALLTGKPRLLKRSVDRTTALKYRDALSRIGIEVAFKAMQPPPQAEQARPAATESAWNLAPVGADVLSEEERNRIPTPEIDTSGFTLAPAGTRLEEQRPPPACAPDVSHMSLAAAGTELLHPGERSKPPMAAPTAGDWGLEPAGTRLENLPRQTADSSNEAPAWSLAPAGAELLNANERRRDMPSVPSTDHLHIVPPA